MSLPVVVRPAARQDIHQGRRWFSQKRHGLGASFVKEVLATLQRIEDMPELYAVEWEQVRAAGVKRFGYVVYYRILPTAVEVLAVMHGGRDSSEWQARAQ